MMWIFAKWKTPEKMWLLQYQSGIVTWMTTWGSTTANPKINQVVQVAQVHQAECFLAQHLHVSPCRCWHESHSSAEIGGLMEQTASRSAREPAKCAAALQNRQQVWILKFRQQRDFSLKSHLKNSPNLSESGFWCKTHLKTRVYPIRSFKSSYRNHLRASYIPVCFWIGMSVSLEKIRGRWLVPTIVISYLL